MCRRAGPGRYRVYTKNDSFSSRQTDLIFKLRENLYPALLLTVCVDGVEHGHDPLLEGGGEIIVLFTLANVLQRGLELLDGDSAVLFTYKHYHCTFIVLYRISTMFMGIGNYQWSTYQGLTLLRSAISEIWSHKSHIIME